MGIETIGRSARTLLALLDLTSQGIGPDKLAPEVRLNFEALAFLGQATFCVAQSSDAAIDAGVANATASLQVPPGKIWIVRGVFSTYNWTATGAGGLQYCPRIQVEDWNCATGTLGGVGGGPPIDLFPQPSQFNYSGASVAGFLQGIHFEFGQPLIMVGGQFIRGLMSGGKVGNPAGLLLVGAWVHEVPA